MIDDPHFSLDLGHPWLELPNGDPQQYCFYDAAREIEITLSAMALDVGAEAIDQFASMLVESRMRAEGDAARAFACRITIYEPIVVPRPWGRAVAYYGHDDGGRQFGYAGMVTRSSVVSLYMSTCRLSAGELMEAMDEVGTRIDFDRAPLHPLAPAS